MIITKINILLLLIIFNSVTKYTGCSIELLIIYKSKVIKLLFYKKVNFIYLKVLLVIKIIHFLLYATYN